MTIDIIGAGIGGLTTAIALRQKGFEVRIFERAAQLQPVGAGIVLAANAMQVFRELGIADALVARGCVLEQAYITDQDLTPLSTTNWQYLEQHYGVKTLGIQRGALQEVLLSQIPEACLHLDHALDTLTWTEEKAILKFSNGRTVESACVLGADGINSKVRQALYPESQYRKAQQCCWRGLAQMSLPAPHTNNLVEAWGEGIRFGFLPVDDQRVYWFAVETTSPKQELTPIPKLPQRFKGFAPLVGDLLAATPTDQIHEDHLRDLVPLPQWHQGVVGLLGDAAHAPTPNLGQGAGQAIEDARVLALCLSQHAKPQAAFAQFEALRRSKVDKIVRYSWMLGKVAHWKNPLARQLRRLLLRSTPQKAQQKQLDELANLVTVPQ